MSHPQVARAEDQMARKQLEDEAASARAQQQELAHQTKLLELQLSQAQARVQELEAAAAAAALHAQSLERRAVAAEGQVSEERVRSASLLAKVDTLQEQVAAMRASGVADTSVATLVALASSPASRAANLALIQSSRAAARIFSPLASSTLFQRSFALPAPGALPYLVVAACLFAVAPLPLALRRLAANEEREGGGA